VFLSCRRSKAYGRVRWQSAVTIFVFDLHVRLMSLGLSDR
jgi:hypothetical protein